MVHRIRFDSGAIVQAGQVLVELDSAMEQAQLTAAKARLALANVTVERSRKLASTGALARQVLDADEAAYASAEGEVGALQAQVDHKSVKAPFSGRAGIRAINLGQYLAPGTTVTTLDSLGGVYVDFSLPQQQLGRVSVGTKVDVAAGTAPPYQGTVTAIDPTVDPATRNLRLRAAVREHHEGLRPGMFVTVTVVLPKKVDVVLVPQTAIVHAPYGDSIFIVEDKPAECARHADHARWQAGEGRAPAVHPQRLRRAATSSRSTRASSRARRSWRTARSSCGTARRSWSTTGSTRSRSSILTPRIGDASPTSSSGGPCSRSR